MAGSSTIRKHDYTLDGSHWDLSLLQISEVPVNQLENNKKASKVDLSNNCIGIIPPRFTTLTHLVWLDLSKNQLVDLPDDFGRLVKLQHLDLYSNQIVKLPLSFSELKRLRWLDLKENPLDPELKKMVGECRSGKECEACASRVVKLMKEIQIRLELERQKRQMEEEEEEKKQKLLQEKKRAEKEKRKAKLAKKKQKELDSKTASESFSGDDEGLINGPTREELSENTSKLKQDGFFVNAIGRLTKWITLILTLFFAFSLFVHINNGNHFPSNFDNLCLTLNNGLSLIVKSDIVKLVGELVDLLVNK